MHNIKMEGIQKSKGKQKKMERWVVRKRKIRKPSENEIYIYLLLQMLFFVDFPSVVVILMHNTVH